MADIETNCLNTSEDNSRSKKTQNIFGYLFDLDKFLTLKNANLFVFSSLNRNFALSLHLDKPKSKMTETQSALGECFWAAYLKDGSLRENSPNFCYLH
jgi:hypothetical protein